MIPRRLAAALFLFVIGEALCALAILVLAFAAPKYMFIAVNLFGVFLALRAGTILGYGLSRGIIFYRMRAIIQRENPLKFWLLVGLNLLGVLAGIFLTRLPIE